MRSIPVRVKRTIWMSVLIVGLFSAGFLAGNIHSVTSAQSTNSDVVGVITEVYNLMQSQYIDPVDPNKALEGALNGMMESLDDPFSGYMSPEDYQMTNEEFQGEIQGIGVTIRTLEDTGEIQVVSVLDGSPAQSAGVHNGDVFHAVNGELASAMTQDELASRVRGPEGTDVNITFARDGELIDMTITRARITIPNVESRVVGDNIGYVKLNQFSANAREELDAALAELDINSRSGLIFDLRDNPGGLLSSAVSIGSAFIKDGPIVTEWFDESQQTVFSADGTYANITVPIVVLVNEGSASASELVSAAMQDTGVARIVGERTFGKGTVQTWHELSNGGGLRLTVARWISPSGRWIHKRGVVPDTLVMWGGGHGTEDERDPQLDYAIGEIENQSTEATAAR
ncbi:MAG: S41 family peptidase [Anaerolineae bacterium]